VVGGHEQPQGVDRSAGLRAWPQRSPLCGQDLEPESGAGEPLLLLGRPQLSELFLAVGRGGAEDVVDRRVPACDGGEVAGE
jgi:hypothetical protein